MRRLEIAPTTQTPNNKPATAASAIDSEVNETERTQRISITTSVTAKPSPPATATLRQWRYVLG